jgi:HPt (histidine-containing phosphotransfer) domain-containing protein
MHIIALTANVNEGERQRCIEAGMDDYCSKPVQRESLLKAIGQASALSKISPAGSPPAAANPLATTPGVALFPGSTDVRPSPLPSPRVPGEGERESARHGPGEGERFHEAGINAEPAAAAVEESLELETVLRRCSGKPALAEKILTKFTAQARESLEKIDASFAAADAAQVARIAHGLKGSAGIAAATAMHTVAAQLEQLAKAGDLSVAGDVLASLHAEVIRCREFTDEALKKLSTMDRVAPQAKTQMKSKEFDDASANR